MLWNRAMRPNRMTSQSYSNTSKKYYTNIQESPSVVSSSPLLTRYLWSRNWPMKWLIFFLSCKTGSQKRDWTKILPVFFRWLCMCIVFEFSDLSNCYFFYCSSSKSELPRLDDNGSLYNLKALGALCLGSLLKYLKR